MIRVVSSGGIPVQGFEWTWGPQRERCGTVVAKLTYALNPGVAELAGRHEAIVTQTVLNAQRTGLVRPTDIVPFKQRTDVLLVGAAYPPDSTAFTATLTIGSLRTVMHFAGAASPVPLPELRASEQSFSPGTNFLDDIDPTAFQAAPRESQSPALPYDCDVALENLHPVHKLLRTTILRHTLVARLDDGPGGAFTLTPDTIVFDTNASTCSVTFRGWRTLKHAPNTILIHVEATAASGATTTSQSELPLEEAMTKEIVQPRVGRALPFADVRPSSHPAPRKDAPQVAAPAHATSVRIEALPIASPLVPERVDPPHSVARPALAPVTAKAASDAAASVAEVERSRPGLRVVPRAVSTLSDGETATLEPIELLWLDETKLEKIRTAPRLASVLDARGFLAEGRSRLTPQDAIERDALTALLRAPALAAAEIPAARAQALDERGRFVSPVVLVRGELVLLFDERTRLEAAVAIAQGTFGATKTVREAIPPAQSTLDNTWALAPVLEHAVEQLRDCVGRISSASLSLFDTQLKRALLERRAFRTRIVLGEQRLRVELMTALGESLPLYLPATLKDHLPLCESFAARLLAELHFELDAFDAPAEALVACALARRLPDAVARSRRT